LFASDGMYSALKLVECLSLSKKRLGELDSETPRLHMVKRDVPCEWNLKGKVMRYLMKDTERLPRELIDGVKLFPRPGDRLTSMLLIPDRTRPMFHVNAESSEASTAQQLANEFEVKLHVWMNT
jgi:mannose-1-phosphate guanylyltransferase / phosphomannomutase